MKKIFFILFLVLLLSTGLYVGATSVGSPTYSMNNTGAMFGRFSSYFNHYYVTSEQEDAILSKKVELTNTYLLDYATMTSEEKQVAEENYNTDFQNYLTTLLGYSVDQDTFDNQCGDRIFTRLDEADHQLFVEKRVELTVQYLSNYDQMTQEEKDTARLNYVSALREFMQDEMVTDHGMGCFGGAGQYGPMGR